MTRDKTGNTLRTIAIVGMGLTATMNIVGGIGTVCAAFLTKDFPPMWSLLEYQWLYQVLMIVTILLGLGGGDGPGPCDCNASGPPGRAEHNALG